ncbi:hypothetical protein TIFTF001_031147 [Ficus carica]|uniref:Uncharacterized protein n=1 Tax=Ficus carica TaxID=3494 RepID=A0AA88E0D5_FICCA|nr:hypothetical protein TIFTF001_031147 [Ficus carica]
MGPEALLEPGRVYFLLPYSALQADVSPLDLACVAKRLNALAKTSRPKPNQSPGQEGTSPARFCGSSPVWSSPARSPNQFAEPVSETALFGAYRSARARSWKPILDTIREKSFNRRSESELQLQESRLEALALE